MTDNAPSPESFADLFKDDHVAEKQLTPGQRLRAVVVGMSPDSIFLDVGKKSEGFLDRKEIEDAEGNIVVKAGDTLDVYFLSEAHNEMRFTTRIGGGSTSKAHLEEAFQSGIPLEGLVKKEIKGGFEVTVAGNIRTFCPYSQMDVKRVADPEEYVGKHRLFKVTQFSEGGRNIVVSHRIIQEEERELQRQELKKQLRVGMAVRGKITSIRNFGAFVDINGIEGLIPISEIGWSRTEDIHEVLTEGQDVEVVILKLDWDDERYSFSLKQALPDPWRDIATRFPVGSFHAGKVIRLAKFGAFVALAPGIDGLIHISKLGGGRRINHPKEVVEEGQAVDVKIEEIDAGQKRISLSLVGDMAEGESGAPGEEVAVKEYMHKHEKHGTPGSLGSLGEILKARIKEKEKK